jgi:putative nucleotidyltransferase with HDIG domain
MKNRSDALELMQEWVSSESLRKHCLSVATSMEACAEKFGEDKDSWWICGLLHDFDWERYPTIGEHPKKGCAELEKLGYDSEIVTAIMGHNGATGVARESLMAKSLFAVDELSGLIMALAKIRPGNFEGMTAKSVKKVMKKKDFAAAINRDEIRQGRIELGFTSPEEQDSQFELVVAALSAKKSELGF